MSKDQKIKYPYCSYLINNPGRHSAALVLAESIEHAVHKLIIDSTSLRNGTITFISLDGCHYAITAKHVFDKFKTGDKLWTIVGNFREIPNNFIYPNPTLPGIKPDVAIQEISGDLLESIGKEPLDLNKVHLPQCINQCLCVGYSEKLKKKVELPAGVIGLQYSIPQTEIYGVLKEKPTGRFSINGEWEISDKNARKFSGMSGGPIFWSNANSYGLLGIIYEGDYIHDSVAVIFGELATVDVIRCWVSEWPKMKV